jgi:hypothetical protein
MSVPASQRNATATADATPLPFELPAVSRKKLTVDFDDGSQPSGSGVRLPCAAEQKTGVVAATTRALPDLRDPARIRHLCAEIIGGACSASAAATRTGSITTCCATIRR